MTTVKLIMEPCHQDEIHCLLESSFVSFNPDKDSLAASLHADLKASAMQEHEL